MAPIVVDTSRFPLIIVRFMRAATDAEFEQYLRELSSTLELGRSASIVVATRGHRTTAHQRHRQATWMHEHRVALRRSSVGVAFVLPSARERLLLAGILLTRPVPTTYRVFTSFAEAEHWALERLRTARLPCPWATQSYAD